MATMTQQWEAKTFVTARELFQFAASDFNQRARAAVQEKGVFTVVLSGGNTPKIFFDTLTQVNVEQTIPWEHIQFFFGDERYVGPEDKESNYHMAEEYLFSKVPVKQSNVYRIPTEFTDPHIAAKEYEQTLKRVFQLQDNSYPPFDLIYLGLGSNSHTASLMPDSVVVQDYLQKSLEKNHQLVAALFISDLKMYRITLTPNAINHGRQIIFLVAGADKATAVWNVLVGPSHPLLYPAQLIQPVDTKTLWLLDQEAAAKLNAVDDRHGK